MISLEIDSSSNNLSTTNCICKPRAEGFYEHILNGVYMYSAEQIKLVRVAVAYAMFQDKTLDLTSAIDEISQDLADLYSGNLVEPAAACIPLMFERNIKKDVFSLLPFTSKEIIKSLVETCNSLVALHFNDDEIFNMLMSHNYATLSEIPFVAEEMPTIYRHISIKLIKHRMTLDEAITAVLPSLSDQYLTKVTHTMVSLLLAPEAKIQLYISARSRKIINYKTMWTNNSIDEIYRENARFHVDHQKSVFLKVDRQLAALNFSLPEINAILKRHNNASISKLSQQIKALPLRSDAMQQLLFTPADNMMTANLPMSKLAMSNELDDFYKMSWVNVGLGTFLLGMLAYHLKPRVLTAPVNLLRYAGGKLLGFLRIPLSQTPQPTEPSDVFSHRTRKGSISV
jgi:hypothetical protein